jgi:metal-responsive CopG/Arc/MetJ family transcriptional regulator
MSKRRFAVMFDADVLARLNEVKERLGLPVSEQIHRGVRSWLESMEWRERHSEEAEPASMSHAARHPQ